MMTAGIVRARRRLEHNATPDDVSASIKGIMDKAAELIGAAPNRALVVIDRTGYCTVVRAMVGREIA